MSYGPGNYLQDFLFMNVCQQMLICRETMRRPVFVGRYYCGFLLRKRTEVARVDRNRLLRYSIQLAWLKQLLNKKLITEEEYNRVLLKLRKDYGVISDLTT